MAEFAVHQVKHVKVETFDYPAENFSPPFRTVRLRIESENGEDTVTLFTRNLDWKLEAK